MGEMTPEVVATIARLLPPVEARKLLEKMFVLDRTRHCSVGDHKGFGCTLKVGHESPHAAHTPRFAIDCVDGLLALALCGRVHYKEKLVTVSQFIMQLRQLCLEHPHAAQLPIVVHEPGHTHMEAVGEIHLNFKETRVVIEAKRGGSANK